MVMSLPAGRALVSSSPWTPARIPGCDVWVHPRGLTVASGADVRAATNYGRAAGVTALRASGNALTRSAVGAYSAFRAATTTSLLEIRSASIARRGHTVVIAVTPDDLNLNNVWENGVAANFIRTQQAAGQMAVVGGNAGNYYAGTTTPAGGVVAAYSLDSLGLPRIYVNGNRTWIYRSQLGLAVPDGAAITDFDLGGFVGYLQDVLIFSRTLTDAEIARVLAYVHRVTGIVPPTDPVRHITFTGDSLTVGSDAVGYWSGVCRDLTGASVVQNRARGGATVSNGSNNLLTNVPAVTFPSIADSPAKRIALVWVGANDLGEGTAPATVLTNVTAYIAQLRAEGHTHVAVCNAIDRNAADPFTANRATFNAGLSGVGADVVIDLAANAALSNDADATYYQADGVHLKDAGHAVVRGIVAPVLAAL